MQQRSGRVKLHRTLKKDRSVEAIRCEVTYDEDVAWYGRGAAGVLGVGVRRAEFVQPVRTRAAELTPDVSHKGVSRRVFFSAVIALLLLLTIPLADTLMMMTALSKAVDGLEDSIETVTTQIGDQQAELARANSAYDVQYLAAQMGMHAATSRDTVYLTVYGDGN